MSATGLVEFARLRPWARVIRPLPTLRIDGVQWMDVDRLYCPRWVSALTILAPLIHDREAEAVAFLDWAVATGFNGIRVFAGSVTWADQTPEAAVEVLPRLLELAALRGLAVEVTAITGSGDPGWTPKDHLQQVAAIVRGRASVVLEIANEVGHPTQSDEINDPDTLRAWGAAYCTGGLWAVGASMETDEPIDGVYPTYGGSFCTQHLDRGRPFWENIRRVREDYAIVEAHRVPSLDNERMGADEVDGSVSGKQRINDPAWFFAAGCLDRGFKGCGGVHHSEAGLHASRAMIGPVQQACAEAEVAGHLVVAAALHGGAGTYYNAGHVGSPVPSLPTNVVRHYSFANGRWAASVALGITGAYTPAWANGWTPVGDPVVRTAADGSEVRVWALDGG